VFNLVLISFLVHLFVPVNFCFAAFLFSFGFVQVMINRPCNELRRAYDMFELTGMMGRKVERFGHHFQQNLSIPL